MSRDNLNGWLTDSGLTGRGLAGNGLAVSGLAEGRCEEEDKTVAIERSEVILLVLCPPSSSFCDTFLEFSIKPA